MRATIFKESIGGSIGGPIGGPIVELTERQKQILDFFRENHLLTKRDLAVKLNINVSAAQNHIKILRKKGVLKRIGGTRGH
ncbi:MAG: HTH domain-containing protein [Candidatus Delongbacteria bacterium]|nr:HTH domain-containing protein [Candidatus Delongbacteria bacterium]MCG2760203.1 HTH domain-containing protein [Candidatus Delongbacteria bacterium]